jgi:hypothetical protein
LAAVEVKVKVGSVNVLPGAKTGATAETLTARGNGDSPLWEESRLDGKKIMYQLSELLRYIICLPCYDAECCVPRFPSIYDLHQREIVVENL